MSGTLRLRGATSGYSELQAPAVAADQTFILPTAGGTLLTTDSPVPKLTLELGSASQPSLTFEGDTDTGLYSSGTNTLNLVTGGANRLNIDNSGRVGINTTSPTKTLDINGTFHVVDESTFDDDVTIYGDAQNNQQGIKLQNGLITAVTNSSQNSVFRGNTTAGGDTKIDLSGGGRASFAGDVYIGANWGGLAPSTTPTITLAATGAATFAGRVNAGTSGVPVATDNAISAINNGSAPTIYIDNQGTGTTSIEATGGATFGHRVNAGTSASPVSNNFAIAAQNNDSGTNATIFGNNLGGGRLLDLRNNSNAKLLVEGDGSVSFASGAFAIDADGEITTNVKSAGHIELDSTGSFSSPKIKLFSNTGAANFTGVLKVDRTVSGDGCFHAALNGTVKASITSAGAATFASTVQVGGNPFPGTATGFAAYIDGSIALSSATSTGTILFGYTTGSSTATTVIKGNGQANFAGSVIHGSLAPGGGGGNYMSVGEFAAYAPVTGNYIFRGWDASSSPNVNNVSIFANGNATFAGNITAANVSDIRFKENITDANSQLADTVALGSQLKNWDWNNDTPLNEELRARRFLGLVAQEAEKVCPGLTYTVPRTKQGAELTPETTDAEGNVTPATYEELDDSYKAINHDILVMKLLGAVAELSAKVAALEAG